MGCIYRHPSMHSSEFNSIYRNDLLKKLLHEKKKIMLMSGFSIDLLIYTHNNSSDFLHPYQFSNMIVDGYISGNLVTVTSNNYAQFLVMKNLGSEKNTANRLPKD